MPGHWPGKQHVLKHRSGADIVHDHWIGLNVAYFGKVIFLNKKVILYRQHSQNNIGVSTISFLYFFKKLLNFWKTIHFDLDTLKNVNFPVSYIHFFYIKFKLNIKRLLS